MATALVTVLITLGWATPALAQQTRDFEAELHPFSAARRGRSRSRDPVSPATASALAVELAPLRIQVNAILPGWFPTALTGGGEQTRWGERIRRKTPAGRWGAPADLVGAVVFLASAASDFVTGARLMVDGGYAVADRFLPEDDRYGKTLNLD
jgi:hypothetical protein